MIRNNKKKLILALLALLAVAFVFSPVKAAVSPFGDTISEHKIGLPSDHEIIFITPFNVDAGETIVLTFADAFIVGSVDFNDIDVEIDMVDLDLAAVPSGSIWGAIFSGQVLTISSGSDSISAGAVVTVKIGTNATYQTSGVNIITNPSITGSYAIHLSGTFGGFGRAYVYVMEDNGFQVTANVLANPELKIKWAVPELRIGAPETNNDATFYIAILTADDSDNTVVFEQSYLATTTVSGEYLLPIVATGVLPGTYDVIIKTHQHVSKKLNDIYLPDGLTVLNFTQADNSASKGMGVLLAGDVNGAGTSPATLGDNVVNSVDLPILLSDLDNTDSDGNQIRANINQDTVINSVDLSILLKNLDVEGER